MNEERVVPHSLEAEQALLGAIMINNEAYYRVSHILKAAHFYEQLHADIFEACAKLIDGGRTANPVTLKPYFEGEIDQNTTYAQYLAMLCSEACTIINAPDYARTIRDTAVRRQLIVVSDEISHGAEHADLNRPASDLIEDAERSLYELADTGRTGSHIKTFAEASKEAVECAAAAYARDGTLSGIPTGLTDLDRLMGGLQASDLIILAARPAMGKTSLATNVAYNTAKSGAATLFYSLEMSAEQLATRILSEQTGIPSSVIRRGDIHESQFAKYADTATRLRDIPLIIDDQGGQKVAQLVSKARRIKRQQGLSLIVVDYIQLLGGSRTRPGDNRTQELTEITMTLKALAKELDVPVVALSQLSRQVEARDDKRPQLSDLRESGSIEQDADVVLFLYREEYYLRMREPKEGSAKHMEWQSEMEQAHGKAQVIIGKQRHGPTGTVDLQFDAHLTRFSNLARDEYLPERVA